jgi:mono/diheme cytochrome c family protein
MDGSAEDAAAQSTAVVEGDGAGSGGTAVVVRAVKAGTVDFRTQVLPIFESRCFECHGNGKRKGGLAMDSAASMTKADDDGIAVKAGEPDESLIVQRIMLPASDPDSMPPEGERLTESERNLIRTWIKEGGVMEAVAAGVAAAPGAVKGATTALDADLARRATEVAQALRARGVIAQPLAQDDPRLDINASLATPPFTDADLAMLQPAAGAIVNLNLARSNVTDAGVASLKGFEALESLRLDSSGVGDAALACVAAMPRLKVLNVHTTKVSDAGLAMLNQARALERVYAWNSQVTPAGASALASSRPSLRINVGQE